ncbi:MAG: DUF5337 domain-containing protein [Pseudomonadota bacterium]
MTSEKEKNRDLARQGRLVGVLIAMTMVLWMAAQWLGGEMGWELRYVFLFDLVALAAFAWGMYLTWQLWRKRRDEE